jgi:hypothetical protein
MINENCKLCAKGVGLEDGLSQRKIAKKYGIGKSSAQRHIQHYKKYLAENGDGNTEAPKTVENTTQDNGEKEIVADDISAINELILAQGDDPDAVDITTKEVKSWDVGNGEQRKSYRVSYVPRLSPSEDALDVGRIFDRARAAKPAQRRSTAYGKALVVVWADSQTGKVDREGGTEELIARVKSKQALLRDLAEETGADRAYFLDAGDGVEGFENTGQQQFTNDLSLMEQVEIETVLEQETIMVLAETHNYVQVAGIPSNHAQWRKGKATLGKPSDDWGIHIKKQIKNAFSLNPAAFGHVDFLLPDPWQEFLTVSVYGTGIGLVHGHQKNAPAQMATWWAEQIHGGELWEANVLVHGHYHHFQIHQDGRHPLTKAMKYVIGAPALDNGSAWVGNIKGASSDAGLLTFVVDNEAGFDVNSVRIL